MAGRQEAEKARCTCAYNIMNQLTETSGTRGLHVAVTGTFEDENIDRVEVEPNFDSAKMVGASLREPFFIARRSTLTCLYPQVVSEALWPARARGQS